MESMVATLSLSTLDPADMNDKASKSSYCREVYYLMIKETYALMPLGDFFVEGGKGGGGG